MLTIVFSGIGDWALNSPLNSTYKLKMLTVTQLDSTAYGSSICVLGDGEDDGVEI